VRHSKEDKSFRRGEKKRKEATKEQSLRRLRDVATATRVAGRPCSPRVVTTPEDRLSTREIGGRITWGLAAGAAGPVDGVDLPDADVEAAARVLVDGVRVARALVRHDALTAVRRPDGSLPTPLFDVHQVLHRAARTGVTIVLRAVAAAGVIRLS